MADDNSKFPKRIAEEKKELDTANHFSRDHIENQPIGDMFRHTPGGQILDMYKAEQDFYRANPPGPGEDPITYETRMANKWAKAQEELASTTKHQDYFHSDFTTHQIDSSDNDGRPGQRNTNDKSNEGFFGGSSTVVRTPSKSGTAPEVKGKNFTRSTRIDGYTNPIQEVTKATRDINEQLGLSDVEDQAHRDGTGQFKENTESYSDPGNVRVPISPLYPFTRMEPKTAHSAVFNSYNRNKIPIADIEHRKAFRHLFFGRPECYIFGQGGEISDQCQADPDFSSLLSRMPHVLGLLSSVHCTGSIGYNDELDCNWNYILSNRVKGFSVQGNSISIDENMTKSVSNNTITPGGINTSNVGNTLQLSFTDTKRLEIFEMLRAWMLYIHKRKRGQIIPSMDFYRPQNKFPESGTVNHKFGHIYDRALEYCAPLFDIVTDETMTNILYWAKYYGIYPTQVTNTGLNSEGGALTEQMNIDAEFRFQARREGLNMNLVEFNYNAGIVDHVGKLSNSNLILNASSPFLSRRVPGNPSKTYMGAAGMFTGSPYIIMEEDMRQDPSDFSKKLHYKQEGVINSFKIVTPQLRFLSLPDTNDIELNLDLSQSRNGERGPVQIKT